jgi:branched-chain amino acid transport system substrate-binding protein
MAPRLPAFALGLVAALLSSCSLTTFGDDACTSNADCRAAFGFGATCGAAGLCAPLAPPARCTRTFPRDLFARPRNYASHLALGVIVNERDPSDVAAENAIELAVAQFNDLDGLDGREVAVVFCTNEEDPERDTASEEEATAAVGRYLAGALDAPALVGPSTSSQAESLYAVTAPLGTLTVSHSATSTALTQLDADTRLLWRTCPPDSEQGAAIADDLASRSVARVAVIYEDGSYGAGLAQVFDAAFRGTATPFPFALGNETLRDAQAMAVAGRAGDFDEVLFISSDFADTQQFLRYAARTPGLTDIPIFLTDTAAASPEFLTDSVAAPLFPRLRGSRPALATGPVYDQFIAAYGSRFMSAPDVRQYQYAPHAYDAAWLVFAGATWPRAAESAITGETIAEGLTHLSELSVSGTTFNLLPGSWGALAAELAAGRGVDVRGASGQLDFDATTDETSGPVEIWRIGGAPGAPAIVVDGVFTP